MLCREDGEADVSTGPTGGQGLVDPSCGSACLLFSTLVLYCHSFCLSRCFQVSASKKKKKKPREITKRKAHLCFLSFEFSRPNKSPKYPTEVSFFCIRLAIYSWSLKLIGHEDMYEFYVDLFVSQGDVSVKCLPGKHLFRPLIPS